MNKKKISKERERKGNKIKSVIIILLAVVVTVSLIMYAVSSSNLGSASILVILAAILLIFFGLFALRRYRDADKGLPFEDERSRRVMEKAAAKSYYVTLYVLVAIGLFSDGLLPFRDVSQATSVSVGVMAILWFAFWAYYNRKEI